MRLWYGTKLVDAVFVAGYGADGGADCGASSRPLTESYAAEIFPFSFILTEFPNLQNSEFHVRRTYSTNVRNPAFQIESDQVC